MSVSEYGQERGFVPGRERLRTVVGILDPEGVSDWPETEIAILE